MERLQSLLREEPVSHILPFLWMKGEDNPTIEKELDQIQACGIREICLESRPHPEFCREGWWKTLDFLCEEAKKRQMRLWILDDYKFPTGYANGGFKTRPEKKKWYLAERHMDVYGTGRNMAVLTENFLPPDGRLLGILAVPKPDGESLAVSGDGILDLTESYENGFVYFDLPEGPYRLFILFVTQTGGGQDNYMNLIDADSVRVLIDEVYEKHYAHYQEYFGNTIAGFFSDEPEFGNVMGYPFDNMLGQKDNRLPWSDQLEECLRKRWGADFLSSLVPLWYDSGEKTAGIRTAYMDELTRLVRTCFSGQLGAWCEEHGVEYIGHIIEDDNTHARLGCSIGHYFREMEGQHMAGIDVVHHQIVPGFTEPVHQWIAGDRDGEFFHFGLAKLAGSASHIQKNKKGRALCEIFGNYGWAEGNSLMKWLTCHMLVRGINVFTPHAFSMIYPDPDCPPHFYAQGSNPGFDCFKRLMRYMNRGAHLMSGGETLTDAAVLYHAESEWSGGEAQYFQKPGRRLMERQMDYDVIPADALEDGNCRVEDGCLFVGGQRYQFLVLPRAQYLDPRVVSFVERSAPVGLRVFVTDALPEKTTEGAAIPEAWKALVTVTALSELGEAAEEYLASRGGRELTAVPAYPMLRSMIVRHADGLAAMYFNESVSERISCRISVKDPAYQAVTLYDAWNNRAESFCLESGTFSLNLEPGEALFCCLERQPADGEIQETDRKAQNKDTVLQDGIQTEENAKQGAARLKKIPVREEAKAILTDWKVTPWKEMGEKTGSGERAEGGANVGDESSAEGSSGADGGSESRSSRILRAGEALPNLNGPGWWQSFTGIYRYEGSFRQDEKKENRRYCLLLPEASDSVRVLLNGKDLGWLAGFPARVEITQALLQGGNELVLEVANTLVWRLKDGSSTHLGIPTVGITEAPILETFD